MKKTIAARSLAARELVRKVQSHARDGFDVVIVSKTNDPDRVLNFISATIGPYKAEITIRHADFQMQLEHALAGSALGSMVAVAGLATIGGPLTVAGVLAIAGLGALAGAYVGRGLAFIKRVRIYRYRGETKISFSTA